MLEKGRKPAIELLRELGIRRGQLYKWKELTDRHGGNAFPGPGRRSLEGSEAEEIARLRQELAQVRQENEILKKPQRSLRRS